MRLISKRQVQELVLYSSQHIARLEKAGQFPKRVPLGPNRVGWGESEVLDWLEDRRKRRGRAVSTLLILRSRVVGVANLATQLERPIAHLLHGGTPAGLLGCRLEPARSKTTLQ